MIHDLDVILNRYRTNHGNDYLYNNMRINRLFGLNELINDNLNSESVICEIGSYYGHSACLFAYYCEKVYCVDTFEREWEVKFDENTKEFDNIIKVKNFSTKASFLFKDYFFDLVYIDAGHSFDDIVGDINHWKNKIKKGGFIAGHDYHPLYETKVIEGLHSLNIIPDKIYEDSSWIKRI